MLWGSGPARDREVAVLRETIRSDISGAAEVFREEGITDFDEIYLSYLRVAMRVRTATPREELETLFATLMAEMVMREFDSDLPRID